MFRQARGIVAFSILISLVPIAHAEVFKAPIDNSQWKTGSSRIECTLTHTIPGYGKGYFSQSSHEHQQFHLESTLGQLKPGKATLKAYPPTWKADNRPRKIAQLNVLEGKHPIKMKSMPVYQLLESLELGQSAAFTMTHASGSNAEQKQHKNEVVLSPVGFQKPYKEYLNCVSQLIPNTFTQLKETVLHFESGSDILSRDAEARLKEVAAFVRADGKIRRIDIAGHSDGKGNFQANALLANKRMWSVKDFMVMHNGVPADIFTMKDYADKKPIAPNKTAAGRAKNRRVVITLYR